MPDARQTSTAPDAGPNLDARWEELESDEPPCDAEPPRRGFWERLGMLFSLHPRGPQGG